tara:strand:+ start:4805 stop:7207 length:2403 start_codon:yes stop_codon:yes gene_type:complete
MSGSDKTKLDGIEALADVTDATNVAAAGAVMDADFTAADEVMVGTGAGTHGQVTLAASQFLAKKAAGAATNVTAAEARTILNVASGADVTGSNAPQAHAASHQASGGDEIKLDNLGTPDDNTDLNATTTYHGLCPKLDNNATNFLNGQGGWAAVGGWPSDQNWVTVKDGGTPDTDCDYNTIAGAISDSKLNIVVLPATYTEDLTLNVNGMTLRLLQGVTLNGVHDISGTDVRVVGEGKTAKCDAVANNDHLFDVSGARCTIQGLTLDSNTGVGSNSLIHINAANCSVLDNTMEECDYYSVFVDVDDDGSIIRGNRFLNSDNGHVYLKGSTADKTAAIIDANYMEGTTPYGIIIGANVYHCVISNNNIMGSGSTAGISCTGWYCSITGNHVYNVATGIMIGNGANLSNGVSCSGNTVDTCSAGGIHVEDDAAYVNCTGNTIINTVNGIHNEGDYNNFNANNIITTSADGILIDASSTGSSVIGNTINGWVGEAIDDNGTNTVIRGNSENGTENAATMDPTDHAGNHVTGGGDTIADAIAAGNSGLMSGAMLTKLNGIATGADVTGSNAPQAHATSHTDGSDDIQSATSGQKGVATAAQITKLDGIATGADVTGSNAPQSHGNASHSSTFLDASTALSLDELITLGSSSATIDFTSKDINSDGAYVLFFNLIFNDDGAAWASLYFDINGDTTAGNYYVQKTVSDGASVTGSTLNSNSLQPTTVRNTGMCGKATIFRCNGYAMADIVLLFQGQGPPNITDVRRLTFNLCTSSTVANITQITLRATGFTTPLATGSWARLYKMA